MKQLRSVFYIPKHERVTDGALSKAILFALISIAFFVTCLVGATWAWFDSSCNSQSQQIQTASYSLHAELTGDISVAENSTVVLDPTQTYTVKLVAGGTAKTGFGKLYFDGTSFHTPQIAQGSSFTFTVTGYSSFQFESCWGTSSETSPVVPSTLQKNAPLSMAAPKSAAAKTAAKSAAANDTPAAEASLQSQSQNTPADEIPSDEPILTPDEAKTDEPASDTVQPEPKDSPEIIPESDPDPVVIEDNLAD